ncbi:MAG TPA: DUF2892 domain-containing protein [Candidatus Margulisiibacteriota bacterium]|nr:DUF2892 domain-containing protein [Candidatus Margulisiibacteriota bacterium]
MKKNIGATDRRIRLILGLLLIMAALYWKCWLCAIAGVILIITAAIGWCGLYKLLKINTCNIPK